MLNFVMLTVAFFFAMLKVIMLSVVMICVIMLGVLAPYLYSIFSGLSLITYTHSFLSYTVSDNWEKLFIVIKWSSLQKRQ
jgi:hypothetical protein